MPKAIRVKEQVKVSIFKKNRDYQIYLILPGELTKYDEPPVYTRSFSELLIALGYCKVLKMLSRKSIERIIAMEKEKINKYFFVRL